MKAYTNLTQSKKLAEILPIESADMCYRIVAYNPDDTHVYQPYCFVKTLESDIPCWSLAALLDQLDDVIYDNDGYEYKLEIIKEGVQYYLVYEGMLDAACYETSLYDDLINACVEMILKLKEKDLL